jgi:hexokinase
VDRESINPRPQVYENFISGMYLGEITRNVLALVDAAPKPILFNGKATERLNSHYGLDTELLSLVESAWRTDAPREEEAAASAALAALRDFSTPLVEERIAPTTLRGLNGVREIVQEHLGYEPGEVSLRDAALVQWVVALVVRWAAWHGGQLRRQTETRFRLVLMEVGLPWSLVIWLARLMCVRTLHGVVDSLYQHYPDFEGRMREALRLLLGEEVKKLVVMHGDGLRKDKVRFITLVM